MRIVPAPYIAGLSRRRARPIAGSMFPPRLFGSPVHRPLVFPPVHGRLAGFLPVFPGYFQPPKQGSDCAIPLPVAIFPKLVKSVGPLSLGLFVTTFFVLIHPLVVGRSTPPLDGDGCQRYFPLSPRPSSPHRGRVNTRRYRSTVIRSL